MRHRQDAAASKLKYSGWKFLDGFSFYFKTNLTYSRELDATCVVWINNHIQFLRSSTQTAGRRTCCHYFTAATSIIKVAVLFLTNWNLTISLTWQSMISMTSVDNRKARQSNKSRRLLQSNRLSRVLIDWVRFNVPPNTLQVLSGTGFYRSNDPTNSVKALNESP